MRLFSKKKESYQSDLAGFFNYVSKEKPEFAEFHAYLRAKAKEIGIHPIEFEEKNLGIINIRDNDLEKYLNYIREGPERILIWAEDEFIEICSEIGSEGIYTFKEDNNLNTALRLAEKIKETGIRNIKRTSITPIDYKSVYHAVLDKEDASY